MTLSIPNSLNLSVMLLLLSGLSFSTPTSAKTSPLAELQKTGFYGRVHAWSNITRKAHGIPLNVPKQAPVIVSDYHSSVGANGLRRSGTHNGVDIFAAIGSPIIAAADGVVIKAKVDKCWGPSMLVSHGLDEAGKPIYALYGHVKNFKVKVGQKVKRGQQIAEMGDDIFTSCGAGFHHLHFQISYSPKSIPLFGWGWASFVSDGGVAPNPHKYWANGVGKITCFEEGKHYKPTGLTYPVPCKSQPRKAKPIVTIVAKKKPESKVDLTSLAQEYSELASELVVLPKRRTESINRPATKELVYQDKLEQEFLRAAEDLYELTANIPVEQFPDQ